MDQTEHIQHMSRLQKQMKHDDHVLVPRGLVVGMFALILGSVGLVTYAKIVSVPPVGVVVEARIEASREIVLIGNRQGLYQVTDPDGTHVTVSSEDKAGFIGVMGRVIDRERALRGVTGDAPITLVRRVNGNIAIVDETTGMSIELIGYGSDNVAAFARLLD